MSYDFAGSDRWIGGPGDEFSSTFDVPLSLVCWVKCTAAQWANTSKDWCLYFGDDFTGNNNSIILAKSVGTADEVTISARTTSDNNASETHPDGTYDDTWVMIAGVFTSDTLRDVYVEDAANTGQATGERIIGAVLDSIKIGGDADGGNNFAGLIAHPAIFDVALTTANIDDLQTAAETGIRPNTVDSANCIAYYPLTVDQSTHADQSGNSGPTLTVNNAVFSSDNPIVPSGGGSTLLQMQNYLGIGKSISGGYR